jgi:hypothetical protein
MPVVACALRSLEARAGLAIHQRRPRARPQQGLPPAPASPLPGVSVSAKVAVAVEMPSLAAGVLPLDGGAPGFAIVPSDAAAAASTTAAAGTIGAAATLVVPRGGLGTAQVAVLMGGGLTPASTSFSGPAGCGLLGTEAAAAGSFRAVYACAGLPPGRHTLEFSAARGGGLQGVGRLVFGARGVETAVLLPTFALKAPQGLMSLDHVCVAKQTAVWSNTGTSSRRAAPSSHLLHPAPRLSPAGCSFKRTVSLFVNRTVNACTLCQDCLQAMQVGRRLAGSPRLSFDSCPPLRAARPIKQKPAPISTSMPRVPATSRARSQALPASARADQDPYSVARAFAAFCVNASRPLAACASVASDVAASMAGNLAKRPAAVCARLGACGLGLNCSAVTAADAGVSGPLDACSATGLADGPAVRADGAPLARTQLRGCVWGRAGGRRSAAARQTAQALLVA